jgi:hypothetical protein
MWGEQAKRVRRTQTGQDSAGRPVYTWDYALLPYGCAVDPGGSVEPAEVGRTQVVTTPKAYFTQFVDLAADDRLVVRGQTWEVVGDPQLWSHPWGGKAGGMVVDLRRSSEEG